MIVLFCSQSFPRSRALLRERFRGTPLELRDVDPSRSLADQVSDVDALVPSLARIDAAVIAAAPRLRAIVQFGAGLDNVDRTAAEARGIAVRNVPGANAQAVAELALFLILALARRLPDHPRAFAAGVVGDPPGHELAGKTLGVVGLGASGRALARMACGIGMDVIALRRDARPDDHARWVRPMSALDDLLSESDVVSLHVPSTAETRGLLDAGRLARMKPTAWLVNAARGDLVDESALVDALRGRRLAGAGLDVYAVEPPDVRGPLFALDNVVLTPHLGGVTHESLARIADRVTTLLAEALGVPLPGA